LSQEQVPSLLIQHLPNRLRFTLQQKIARAAHRYSDVNVLPDLKKRQRDEEAELKKEAERRNRSLTETDMSKNLHWVVVGARGERRLTKEKVDSERSYQARGGTARGGARGGRGVALSRGRILTGANRSSMGPPRSTRSLKTTDKARRTETTEEVEENKEMETEGVTESESETETEQVTAVKQGGARRRATSEKVTILYLNAQSIVKKVDELGCVADLSKPDLILVTESWCNEDISNAFLSLDGYELIPDLRMDRETTARGRGGGGLLVYAKEGVRAQCVKGLLPR
jgi:hypothetical protein